MEPKTDTVRRFEDEKTPSGFLSSWKLILGLALTAVFLWLAFRRTDLGKFVDTLGDVRIWPLFLANFIQIAAHVFRGWRWKIMLYSSHPELRRRHAFAAMMVGYAVNVIVPRGGEVARAFFLRRIARTPLAAGLSSVLAERLLDLAALCVLFPASIWVYRNRLEALFPGVGRGVFVASMAAAGGLALVWMFGRHPERMTHRLQVLLRRFWPSRAEQFSRNSRSFFQGLGGLFNKETAIEVALLSGAIWFFYILGNWALFFTLPGSGLPSLTFVDAAAITVVVTISYVLPAPGGTGTTHFFVGGMMAGIYGIDPARALAYATLLHLSGIVSVLVVGSALAIYFRPAGDRYA